MDIYNHRLPPEEKDNLTSSALDLHAVGGFTRFANDQRQQLGHGEDTRYCNLASDLLPAPADPPNLAAWRQRLFDVEGTILMSEDQSARPPHPP